MAAKDKATGKEQQIKIQANGDWGDADIKRMVQEAETNALADKALRAFVETKNQGHAMIHDCEKSMSEHGATWFAAEMDEAKATILATRTAADGRSQDVLSKAMESLTAVAKRIEDAGL